jgi:uncharacterized protein
VILHDVNVLVYAYRADTEGHERYHQHLEEAILSPSSFGYSSIVLSGFIRVVTHPRVFAVPSLTGDAFDFADAIRGQPNAVELKPGARHWEIFESLCASAGTRGNLVADAYHAALAIEWGADWITTDRDFARFAGLRWKHPFD